MTEQSLLPKPFGAIALAKDKTLFSVWAPDAKEVRVSLLQGPSAPLQAQEGGWFQAELDCAPGTAYQLQFDGGPPRPDPASRAQADDVHGPSLVVDLADYPWRQNQWRGRPWSQTILYELHVGLLGGFVGVEAQLPRLRDLGITAVELMPLHQFGGTRSWGYDGVLTYAPASVYGSPAQLQHLVDYAHELGMMIFVDVVYNHFGPDGNYLSQYASAFFRDDIHTPWGQAIDFRRPQVREFFIQNALMWVQDYRVDGLRFDAVHAISEKDFLEELAHRVRERCQDRQVHLVLENEHNKASLLNGSFDAQWDDDGHNVLHHLLTDEDEAYYRDYARNPEQKLARVLREGFVFQGETDRRGLTRGEPSAHLPPTAFVLFLQNHDQVGNRALGERLSVLARPEALRAATALLLLSPLIPLLFMGEEWGSRRPFLFFTDFHDELATAVREGRRSEFAEFAAFDDPQSRERIPDPNAQQTFEASRPDFASIGQGEHAAWYALYHQLLQLRMEKIVPHLDGAQALGAEVLGKKAVTARWRLKGDVILRIDINLGAQELAMPPIGGEALYASRQGALETAIKGKLPGEFALISWNK